MKCMCFLLLFYQCIAAYDKRFVTGAIEYSFYVAFIRIEKRGNISKRMVEPSSDAAYNHNIFASELNSFFTQSIVSVSSFSEGYSIILQLAFLGREPESKSPII